MPMLTRRQLRGWLLLLLTVVAVGLTVGLAVEARIATDRHRAAAEAGLRDRAEFAALTFRQLFIARAWAAILPIFRAIDHGRGVNPRVPLPPVGVLRTAAEQVARCGECGPILRPVYFFRLLRPGDSVEVDGPPLAPARRAELAARIDRMPLRRDWREWDYATVSDTLGPTPAMVFLTEPRDSGVGRSRSTASRSPSTRSPASSCGPRWRRSRSSRRRHPTACPTTRSSPSPSCDPTAAPRSSSRPGGLPDTYMSSIPGSRFLDIWTIRVRLDPAVASGLLAGGVPPARTPLLTALVAMAVLLILATAAVAWRALELADLRAEFVASVSHELRTPLAQILLFGDSLTLGTMRTRRDVRVAGGIIVGEARRLLRLVDNVLLFGRQGRRLEVRMKEEPLAPLVRDVVAGFAPVAAASEARLATVRLDDVAATLDDEAMRQVLLNLLDNAVKYGPRGQTVSLGLALADGRARLWVEDEGPGIPPGDRARVWRPFVRLARDVDRQAAGSGIGLSLVREIVARHRRHGDDRGDARGRDPGRGGAAGGAGGRTGARAHGRTGNGRRHCGGGHVRILIIEDNHNLVLGLRHNLEFDGHRVDAAFSGAAGLERARAREADMIILDLMIPRPDGFQVLRTLREEGVETPVIVLTARGTEEDKVRGLRLGADDYVTKPFGLLELMARVDAIRRRIRLSSGSREPSRDTAPIVIGDIRVEPATRTVTRADEPVALRPKEFELLLALARRDGEVVSRYELLEEVWGYGADVVSRTVDTHVGQLRAKLERNPAAPRLILTVRKSGYRLQRPLETGLMAERQYSSG